MPQIFISYRHLDSIDITSRLWDHLKARFGEPNVFLDYKRMMGGDEFLEVIDRAVDSADVVLSIIGPKWKGEKGLHQPSRINDTTDIVRRELEHAQRKKIPILPIIVGGTDYLSADDLPNSLKKLADVHALQLRSGLDFDGDVRRIVECLERLTGSGSKSQSLLAGSWIFRFSPPLNSSISQKRSMWLAVIRTSAVLTASNMTYRGVQ